MKLKQGYQSNEDFIKSVMKELKVYKKHGGEEISFGVRPKKKS